MGALHLAQGVAILSPGNDFALPVTATFMDGPPGASSPQITSPFDVRLAPGVAAPPDDAYRAHPQGDQPRAS